MKMVESQTIWMMGIDWGRQRHQACVMDADGKVLGNQSFVHSGDGLTQLVQWCLQLTASTPSAVRVGIETPHGAVVTTLLSDGFEVYSINPLQSNRFRDRHSPVGAKDDRRDAWVLADALRTDVDAFRQLSPKDELQSRLFQWLRDYNQLVDMRIQLSNRIGDLLCEYYPQFLQVSNTLTAQWVLVLWQRAPNPQKAKRIRLSNVETLLRHHRVRAKSAEQILDILRQPALLVSAAEVDSKTESVKIWVEMLEAIQPKIKLIEKKMDRCLQQLDQADMTAAASEPNSQPQTSRPSDAAIIQSMPGAGRIVTVTLLAKADDALKARNHDALRCQCGVAPVTKRSGKIYRVQRRQAADRQLSEAVYHWARVAIQHDPISRSKYQNLRQKGHRHARALRTVADRLLMVLCAMLRDGTLFQKSTEQKAILRTA